MSDQPKTVSRLCSPEQGLYQVVDDSSEGVRIAIDVESSQRLDEAHSENTKHGEEKCALLQHPPDDDLCPAEASSVMALASLSLVA